MRGPCLARPGAMTIQTISDPKPDAEAAPANEPPITSTIQPPLEVPPASSPPDLESRIRVRRGDLKAKLVALKGDMRLEASAYREALRAKLSELAHVLKRGLVSDWTKLGDNMKRRLEHWLRDTTPQRRTRDGSAPHGTGEVGQP
jgi:hypothetical protein